jgi:23S rRNA (adenine-N6)-dimethyltransferase
VPASGGSPWGWHRLAPSAAQRLVADAGVRPGDLVVDVGAGTGAVTAALVDAGARVIAVELHPGRAATLRTRFADEDVTVVRADAADLRLPRRPFRVVANPPFAVAGPILHRLLARGSRLTRADIVLQLAAARRWATGRTPGAARWGADYAVGLRPRIPRRAFTPRPPVDCTTLVIARRGPAGSGIRRRA